MTEHDANQSSRTAAESARKSEVATPPAASAWLPLPGGRADALCLLGPDPDQARTAVDLLREIDAPLTVVQALAGGVCDADGHLVEPLELLAVRPPSEVGPDKQVPQAAVLEAYLTLPALWKRLGGPLGTDALPRTCATDAPRGPLLYCRKRHRIFEAFAPDLPALPALPAAPETLIAGQAAALDHADALAADDPAEAARFAAGHACVDCPERARCYPAEGQYAFAPDRLALLSTARAPLPIAPLGAWTLAEAAGMIGGVSPTDLACADSQTSADPLDAWRRARAVEMERFGPPRLLSGETDGRELLEVARLKLALIADVLAQLGAFWRAAGRPHLCWNPETVRVVWRPPGATPASCWGLRPILRKCGLHPLSPLDSIDGRPLPYPPAFSDESYLAPPTRDAARYFDDPRPAALFVKKAVAGDGEGMTVLIEGLGIPWELFCPCDTVAVTGDGWRALLAPLPERDPDDGEGLPLRGTATGDPAAFKQGASFDHVEVRWMPRFGEAVDLHALGILLLETLLGHDQRAGDALHDALATELAELVEPCANLPPAQRETHALHWIAQRSSQDAPVSLWTPRNLLFSHEARRAARLDALPAVLWQSILVTGLRMTTTLDGFSYCPDRGADVPRAADGEPLPLVELRGLIALLDDHLFGRFAPAGRMRSRLGAPPR